MAKKKYIKDSRGMTVAVTTDTLGLEKPLLNENYDIDVHNRNMDKIDEDLTPIDDSYIIELFQHDGDTTNPRDYYTKVEADEKFASKEETNNALNKANEALQAGSNVKQSLVDKLTSEGLDVSTNNTFEELISGIALGKKWASGTARTAASISTDFNLLRTNYGSTKMYYFDIVDLNFRPSLVFYISKAADFGYGVLSNLEQYRKEFTPYIYFIQGHPIDATTNMTTRGFRADSLVFLSNGTVRLPALGSSIEYNWIAFE